MTKSCDIENNINIKKNHVEAAKERCLIFKKVIFDLNRSSKSNTDCITALKKVKINNINSVVIATLNMNSLPSNFDKVKSFLTRKL